MNKNPSVSTSRKKVWCGVSALAVAVFSLNAHASVIDSFEANSEIKKWAFYNGAEHPGGRGSFVGGTENGNAFGELRYDFTAPTPLPEKFDPRYVQVTRTLTTDEAAGVARVRLHVWLGRPGISFCLRWIDASGQVFQSSHMRSDVLPFGSAGFNHVTIDMKNPASFWGGAKDGVVHFPIKKIAVVCNAAGQRNTGWLRVDNVELLPDADIAELALNAPVVINNFTTTSEASQWKFYNGAEFPGAKGSIVSGLESSSKTPYSELRYDFRPPVPQPAGFNPHYVQASRTLSAGEAAAGFSRLQFKVQASRPDLKLYMRWTDQSGQTLQKQFNASETLEQTAAALHTHVLDMGSADMYWDGANDGKTRFPLKSIAFICDATGFRDQGWLRFAELAFLPDEIAVNQAFDTAADLSSWRFGNGGEFPGARGNLTHHTDGVQSWAQLNYDFSQPANWTSAFDPHYVEAWRSLPPETRAVRIRLTASAGDVAVRIRYTDSGGQTFHGTLTHGLASENIAPNTWIERVYSFASTNLHWGGANDGVVRFPIKRMSIIMDAPGNRGAGHVKFDDIGLSYREVPVLSLDGSPVIAAPAQLGTLRERSGVNIAFTSDNRALDAIAMAGFGWIRKDAHWDHIERTRGVYNFAAIDALVSAAEQRGLSTLLILDYGNSLYTGSAMNPPKTAAALDAYKNYCAVIAARYSGRKVAFEIWNEPDVPGFWGGVPNAEEFSALLAKGIAGVKSGNSYARVITGGLSSLHEGTYRFLETQIGSNAMAGATGLGMHFYGAAFPERQWSRMLELKNRAASVLGGKLWCSEWGFSSTDMSPVKNGADPVGRHIQASMVVRQLLMGWWADLPTMVLYDIRDAGADPFEPEHNFGLLTQNYTEKPAMIAVTHFFAQAKNRSLTGLVSPAGLPTGVHIACFGGENDQVYMIWAEEDAVECRILLTSPTDQAADLYGNAVELVPVGNGRQLSVKPGQGPIYVNTLKK